MTNKYIFCRPGSSGAKRASRRLCRKQFDREIGVIVKNNIERKFIYNTRVEIH